jgi:hypothetical protein
MILLFFHLIEIMASMTNDADWVSRLSKALQLNPDFDQDWGICNSDASRALEFIAFYNSWDVVHTYEPEALAELVFESFNDLLIAGDHSEGDVSMLLSFIANSSASFPMAMEYWGALDLSAYPVSEYIRRSK